MAIKHTFITKDGQKTKTLTPVKAIREKCLDCCAWSKREVKLCVCTDCSLYPFRFGVAHKFTPPTGGQLNN